MSPHLSKLVVLNLFSWETHLKKQNIKKMPSPDYYYDVFKYTIYPKII